MPGLLGPRVGLGAVALLGHQAAEPGLVHRDPLLRSHLERQVDREAERVVQLERPVGGQLRGAGRLRLAHRRVEDRGAGRQGAAEGLFLGVRDLADPREVLVDLGVRQLHLVARDRQQLGQRRGVDAEQPHRAHGPAQQAAQHVTASLVARRDAVADQHQRAADVVGDDPHPHVVPLAGAVALATEVGGTLDDRVDLVDLVDVVDALQQEGHALQAHPGVDVLLRQVTQDREVVLGRAGPALVLHEDQVPELEVAVARTLDVTLGAVRRTAVDQDLAAGPAGAGDAHRPVVLGLAEPHDLLVRQARDALPQRRRLVVVLVDGDEQVALGQAEAPVVLAAGDQVPRHLDGAGLEVVAEAEVAVHLEERAVARGLADLLDVEGAHALLDAGRALVRRGLLADEVRHERHHAGVDEQQVGVVEQQRSARDDGVTVVLEEPQPPTADLGRLHGAHPSSI